MRITKLCFVGLAVMGLFLLSACPGEPEQVVDAGVDDASLDRFARELTVLAEPVVSDDISGLIWQGCSAGQSGANCATGSASTYAWSQALADCEQVGWAGYDDWRLPSIRELLSISEDQGNRILAIDGTAFPATPSSGFWTASTVAWDVSQAWYVYFSVGGDVGNGKTDGSCVRCVRLGS